MSHVEMREISVIEMMWSWLYVDLPSHQTSPKRETRFGNIEVFLDVSMFRTT